MQKNKISTIIFDFGGVLTQKGEIFSFLNQSELKYNKSLESIKNESKVLWDKSVIGKISPQLYWDLLGKYFGVSPEQLLKECIELDGFNLEVYNYIKDLKGKYRLAMITNIIEDWFNIVDLKYKIRGLFDEVITSYEVGIVKPNKEIYQYTLQKINISAHECIFIDDKESNTLAAESIGINVILFKNLEQLKIDIKKYL